MAQLFHQRGQIKRKKSVEEEPFSLFQDLSPLLVASFRLASFRNIKCGKCGLLVISVVFVKSISDIFFPYFIPDVCPQSKTIRTVGLSS